MNKNIREIEFHNVELNPQHETEKLSRIDIFAILDNKDRVNIEVQCVNQYNMAKRTLFYWAHMFLHNNALKSEEKYQELKPAITINVLGYEFLPDKKAHSMHTLYDLENQHRLTDAIELHFLEVPKFEKKSARQQICPLKKFRNLLNDLDYKLKKFSANVEIFFNFCHKISSRAYNEVKKFSGG